MRVNVLSITLAIFISLLFSLPAVSSAAVFVVDSTADNITEDGQVTLREAILAANTNTVFNADVGAGDVTGDQILFDSTVFASATITLSNTAGFGDIEITDDLLINGTTGSGSGATDVTINGNNSNRIFTLSSGTNGGVVVSGLTLENGDGTDNPGGVNDKRGGAIFVEAGSVQIFNLTITNSSATQGGAIFNNGGAVSALGGVTISNCSATSGGAYYGNEGSFSSNSSLDISSNSATSANGSGGGVYLAGGSFLLNAPGAIESNSAMKSGGNFYVAGGTLTLNNGTTPGNGTASGDLITDGGGNIYVAGGTVQQFADIADGEADGAAGCGGSMHVAGGEVALSGADTTNSDASGANGSGGGICQSGGILSITNSTISGNEAHGDAAANGGGGLFITDGEATLDNCIILNNTASGAAGSGGGILSAGGSLQILQSTISVNTASRAGGGIELRSVERETVASVFNSIVSSNDPGSSPGNGAAIHVTAPDGSETATLTLSAGLITNNSATSEGGGLWNDEEGVVTIFGTQFTSNSAAGDDADNGGGGLFNNGGTLVLNGVTLSSNDATGAAGSGGGILNDGGSLTLNGGIISQNTAVRAGGGIEATAENGRDSTVTLTAVSISENTAGNTPGNGGGLHVTDTAGGTSSLVTIQSNSSVLSNTANQEGGGLWNDAGGTMIVSNSLIQGNEATASNDIADAQGGGGVFNNGGTLTIESSNILSNTVTGNSSSGADDGGGGIFNDGRNNAGTVTISSNSRVAFNEALDNAHNGGGILNIGGSNTDTKVNIIDSTVDRNQAARAGGGIENNAGTLEIETSRIEMNTANVNGGAIHHSGASTLTMTESVLHQNEASDEGGGFWQSSDSAATAMIFRSTLSENTAQDGGGIFNDGSDGDISLQNVTISGNTASNIGGGISSENGGTLTINNSTIASNVSDSDMSGAGNGGGLRIVSGATLVLVNSIIANNIDNNGIGNDIVSNTTLTALNSDIENSIIEDANGGHGITNGTNGNLVGTDPLLGAIADNGGAVATHLLQTGSIAIDAGSNAACASVDARNFMRPQDGLLDGMALCDIGAVEIGFDCNSNGTFDTTDVVNQTSEDCDSNLLPDECQNDADSDGTIDSCDSCAMDPAKVAPGACGCGLADTDTDSDGTPNCQDSCPNDPAKIDTGVCGCGISDIDSDSDATADCQDDCSQDPAKLVPGDCGCGIADTDTDSNGEPDCLLTSDFDTRATDIGTSLDALLVGSNRRSKRALKRSIRQLQGFTKRNRNVLNANADLNVLRQVKRFKRLVNRLLRSRKKRFERLKNRATSFFTETIAPLFETIAE